MTTHLIDTEPRRQAASRDGWSRCWQRGGPHYFVAGASVALCGSPAALLRGEPTDHPLTLTDEPDGERPERERGHACPHCAKKVARMRKAGGR